MNVLLLALIAVAYCYRYVFERYSDSECSEGNLVGYLGYDWSGGFAGNEELTRDGGCVKMGAKKSASLECSGEELAFVTYSSPDCSGEVFKERTVAATSKGCSNDPTGQDVWRKFSCSEAISEDFAHMVVYKNGKTTCNNNANDFEMDVFLKIGHCFRHGSKGWRVKSIGEDGLGAELEVFDSNTCENGTEAAKYEWMKKGECNQEKAGTRRASPVGSIEFDGYGSALSAWEFLQENWLYFTIGGGVGGLFAVAFAIMLCACCCCCMCRRRSKTHSSSRMY